MTADAINVTRTLAQFIVASRVEDMPENVLHEAKRALLHWIGCAVGGSHEQSVESALAALTQFSGPPQASVFHAAAAALIARRVGEQEFADAFIQRRDVIALRDKVTAQPDAQIREDEAHVTVKLSDGRTLRQHVEHAAGTAERPMTDREIETKFRALCEPYLPASQITSLIDRCWNITDVQDAATFAQLASVT